MTNSDENFLCKLIRESIHKTARAYMLQNVREYVMIIIQLNFNLVLSLNYIMLLWLFLLL